MQIPTPNRLDSVSIRNTTTEPVRCVVSLTNLKENGDELTEEVLIGPGEEYSFDEKVQDMGGWTAICAVKAVKVLSIDKEEGETLAAMDMAASGLVKGIVKKMALLIEGERAALLLKAAQ
jgi:hypothetical protein